MDRSALFCLVFLAVVVVARDRSSSRDSSDSRGNYVRIKFEILQLTNDQGLISTGSHCDFAGTCDPVCYANLDTERPNAVWPGSKPEEQWPTVFGVDNINSPNIGVTIKKDVCDVPFHVRNFDNTACTALCDDKIYQEANLRMYCMDRDPASRDDLINSWDCPISRTPSANEGKAEWSPVFTCLAKHLPDKIKLTYRYQIYHITRLQCNTTLPV